MWAHRSNILYHVITDILYRSFPEFYSEDFSFLLVEISTMSSNDDLAIVYQLWKSERTQNVPENRAVVGYVWVRKNQCLIVQMFVLPTLFCTHPNSKTATTWALKRSFYRYIMSNLTLRKQMPPFTSQLLQKYGYW